MNPRGDVIASAGDERCLETCFNRGIGRAVHETLGYDVIMAVYADEFRLARQIKNKVDGANRQYILRQDAEYILRS